ncbi:unnamed protein product [Lactuca saligna]|uniref:Uncharacterized protein n=1 Tax=Lactuca saligna TaxID=75948 RepID=A0AA36EMT3_LACSI|nr:unnamed protein product [Lactuca saligna]
MHFRTSEEYSMDTYASAKVPMGFRNKIFSNPSETNQELQTFIKSLKNPSNEVLTPKNTVDDPYRNEAAITGDVPDLINVSDDPLKFTGVELPEPNVEDDLSDEIMFDDDNTLAGIILVLSTIDCFVSVLPLKMPKHARRRTWIITSPLSP